MAPSAESDAATEQRALRELIDRLAEGPLTRASDADTARKALADCGLWGLGVDERFGGGGADHATTMMAIGRVSMSWPAVGWGMAQLHAAAPALAQGPTGAEMAAAAVQHGNAVGVVDLFAPTVDSGAALLVRVNTLTPDADLLVLGDDHFAVLAAAEISDQRPLPVTGLDGIITRSARIASELAWQSEPDVEGVRAALYTGATAVAAGIARGATAHARNYARTRVQFGAPLTALPTMQDELLRLEAAAQLLATQSTLLTSAVDAAATMARAVETALDVAGRALQCLGGYGYLEEYPIAGLFRDAVSLCGATAASDVERRAASVASDQ
jgi:alkylation response protein AidB-like acyl-CoA dehydrogenase